MRSGPTIRSRVSRENYLWIHIFKNVDTHLDNLKIGEIENHIENFLEVELIFCGDRLNRIFSELFRRIYSMVCPHRSYWRGRRAGLSTGAIINGCHHSYEIAGQIPVD
jgi:hypothetical protein